MVEMAAKMLVICLLVCFLNAVLVDSQGCTMADSCPTCPTGCECVSTTANCSGLNYTSLQDVNEFTYQYLYFSRNKFTEVASRALTNLSAVVNLDLSSNNITKLNDGSFDGAQFLETINLADNKLTDLADNAFKKLNSLKTLDLSGNALGAFNEVSFEPNMTRMTTLLLGDNKLSTLSNITFIFPNLQTIDLSGNVLNCVSSMKWISTWLDMGGKTIEGICDNPAQLQGKAIDSILPQQFDDPSYMAVKPTTKMPSKITNMETTVNEINNIEESGKDGPNAAAIVLPILFILILLIVGAVVFWKKYWQPHHDAEKKYSAVNREGNAGNRVYSDVTTDL